MAAPPRGEATPSAVPSRRVRVGDLRGPECGGGSSSPEAKAKKLMAPPEAHEGEVEDARARGQVTGGARLRRRPGVGGKGGRGELAPGRAQGHCGQEENRGLRLRCPAAGAGSAGAASAPLLGCPPAGPPQGFEREPRRRKARLRAHPGSDRRR